ncbi:hypothetical protein POJ06DRAFT_251290 [Lipomyces tetrasporus]|uniref:Galactose oxidase n=1 Tax=Lipomyces tetrasporus TaxID=54092 RepID=A0AAD7QTV6_9ASCO|nr:uncharacterized protein POJ06DRAFT_251290 [Lipomyces tetrasporus]KAJ8101360.1 hypothetical protein POJ06DRAFT_251290 [Lipomyces tetrasporus]
MAFLHLRKRGNNGKNRTDVPPTNSSSTSLSLTGSNGDKKDAGKLTPKLSHDGHGLLHHELSTGPSSNGHTAPPIAGSNHGFQHGEQGQPGRSAQTKSQQYPWAQRPLIGPLYPFPRYGHSTSNSTSKTGNIYLFGGLKGSTAKNDLWVIEADTYNVRQLQAVSDLVSARYGHASELVGNAFIVFGGDTRCPGPKEKMDDNLYFLNTSTYLWSKAIVIGPRPHARYGHTMNIIGSKLYVFGGQFDDIFFNDLYSFDLNTVQGVSAESRWELVAPASDVAPPTRTNHSTVVFNGKLYIFGGTNSTEWYNDTWCFDPVTGTWKQLSCVGYFPKPCEGHKAAIVGDVMYIFGGRSLEGTNQRNLASLKLTTNRWYTFQNMGPAPSPRSGHTMSVFGSKIFTLGGQPAPGIQEDYSLAYVLDTARIRYPADETAGKDATETATDRPIATHSTAVPQDHGKRAPNAPPHDERIAMYTGPRKGPERPYGNDSRQHGSPQQRLAASSLEFPRPPIRSPKSNDSPRHQEHYPTRIVRDDNDVHMRGRMNPPGYAARSQQSLPDLRHTRQRQLATRQRPLSPLRDIDGNEIPTRSPQPAPGLPTPKPASTNEYSESKFMTPSPVQGQKEVGASPRPTESPIHNQAALSEPPKLDNDVSEMERLRRANKWFEAELLMARQAGYKLCSPSQFAHFELEQATLSRNDARDTMFIQAMLSMKAEIEQVRKNVYIQTSEASLKIAEVEKERDVALKELDSLKKETPETHQLHERSLRDARELERTTDGSAEPIDSSQEHLTRTQFEIEAIKVEVSQLKEQIADGEAAKADLVAARLELQSTQSELESAHEQLDTVQQKLAALEAATAESDSLRVQLNGEAKSAEVARGQVAELQKQLDTMDSQNTELVASLAAADTEINGLRLQLEDYEKQQDVYAEVEEVKLAISESARRIESLEKQADSARAGKASAEQKLKESKSVVADLHIKLESAESQIEELTTQNEELSKEVAASQSAVMARFDKFLGKPSLKNKTLESEMAAMAYEI